MYPSKLPLRICHIALLGLVFSGCDRAVDPSAQNQNSSTTAAPTGELTQAELGPSGGQLGNQSSELLGSKEEFKFKEPEIVAPTISDSDSKPEEKVEVRFVEFRKSNDPNKMMEYIGEVDRSIDRLLISNQQRADERFKENATTLAKIKFESGKFMASLPNLTDEQVKFATRTQLVALSHLSGLKDVQSAKQLEALAKSLLDSKDAELRQQGQIVLFGFAIQNLQNGVESDSSVIVNQAKQLLADPRFRSRLEMTSLLHAIQVFDQMGYREQISPLQRIAFDAFSSSTDKPLRFESWNQLVGAAPSREQFLNSIDQLGGPQFDGQAALESAKSLIAEFPNAVTLEVLSDYVPLLEYSEQAKTAQQLIDLLEPHFAKLPEGSSLMAIQSLLNERNLRIGWVGRELGPLELVDLNGNSYDQSKLRGKVVLVEFWTSQSLPCLKELPFLEKSYRQLNSKGFEILSVNMDIEPSAMRQFAQDHPTSWMIYHHPTNDPRPFTQQFGITMFPHSLLVDRAGKVVKVNVRGLDIETDVASLLGN